MQAVNHENRVASMPEPGLEISISRPTKKVESMDLEGVRCLCPWSSRWAVG